jgi:hypothetical protein
MINPMGVLDFRDFVLKYKEDKDEYNTKYQELFGEVYSTKKFTVENDFLAAGHNALHAATANTHVLSNAALGPAVAAQAPGALFRALGGPQQDQDRQQQEHGGASGNARDAHCWASIAVAKAVIAAATC